MLSSSKPSERTLSASPEPLFFIFLVFTAIQPAMASDLDVVIKRGELRHLGIPYANFVVGTDAGLEIEVMKRFANYLGVSYRFVVSDWLSIIPDLTGKQVHFDGKSVEVYGDAEIRGDIIGTGMTILPWRKQVVDFSSPTFPTQIWVIAKDEFPVAPIEPTGDIKQDIAATRRLIRGKCILGKSGTCLDHSLYGLTSEFASLKNFKGSLNDVAPALLKGEADVALLDVPDALVALELWPGDIKVLGPLSVEQRMGAAFRRNSPRLRQAFNYFYSELRASGEYRRLVKRYYPTAFEYFDDFFNEK